MPRFLLLLFFLLAGSAAAQPPRMRQAPGDRQALEQRFRERLAAVMRERLGLSDEQVTRLAQVNERLDQQRREMFREEVELRRQMRRAVREDSSASPADVSGLLDRVIRLQHRKADLLEAEQKELATFLSPVQRARYLGMQEQLRRQMEEMRERREAAGRDSPAGEPPPRRFRRPPSP